MNDFLAKLFSSDFMGHGYCYLWKPEIIWLHALSDGLIAISYYFIPLTLAYLVRKRRDLPFHWMFFMFGLFILSCGTTHVMEIWTLWNGTYRLAGVLKAITAAASVATAIALVPLVPKALQLASPAQLRAANQELANEITERGRVEKALEEQRNFIEAVLDAVGTLIVVLDLDGNIVECNTACERVSGRKSSELTGRKLWEFFAVTEEGSRLRSILERVQAGHPPTGFESYWSVQGGRAPLISWTTTLLRDANGNTRNVIAAGVDITESRHLESTILEISAREQARIGQDLHDGLGQELTGIAFVSKTLERDLADRSRAEAGEVAKIVQRVNQAISRTRELSRGLLPVSSGSSGLMEALSSRTQEVRDVFGIQCHLICEESVPIHDDNIATHLYRIAQEAINNAIKHGQPTQIDIELVNLPDGVGITITDNGVGIPPNVGSGRGMGLRIMNYRANMIGGTLEVTRGPKGGTVVTCHVLSAVGESPAGSV